jgi:chromosome segregation ATPase
LTGASVYLFLQTDRIERELVAARGAVLAEVTEVREASALLGSANQRNLESLREQLDVARRNATLAVGEAKAEALRHAEQLAERLQQEQARQREQVANELSSVKEAASAANTRITGVSTEVSSVRGDVASTKAELQKTVAELKTVRGDLGLQSGLVATNAKQLSALVALGDRNYYEFNILKTKQHQKVGNILLLIKKTDPKNNKYTVELVAGDKKFEKKDKYINEPLQFLSPGARQPNELVVNEVRKDQIIGYLSAPKSPGAR